MTLLIGPAQMSVCACLLLLGCSTATTLHLRDGTMVEGVLAPRTHATSLRLEHASGPRDIPMAEVVDVSHPGTGRIISGSILAFMGTVGQVTVGALAGQSSSPSSDPFDDEDFGCEFCVLAFPGTLPPLAFGTGLLLHGLALRMESQHQWSTDGTGVGAAHLRIGGAALAAGLVFAALTPMIFSDRPAMAGVGFSLVGFAPGFALSGIALLIRGGRLRRGQRPAIELTARGFAFDLSL